VVFEAQHYTNQRWFLSTTDSTLLITDEWNAVVSKTKYLYNKNQYKENHYTKIITVNGVQMKKEFETKKIVLSLLVLTILISVFGTLAVLNATKDIVKKIGPGAAAEQAAAKESAEQLSSTSTISFVVLERPKE